MRFLRFAALGAVALCACLGGTRAAQQAPASASCEFQTNERIVAIGDVHGAFDRLVTILRAAGLVDEDRRWSGGRAVLVQTGDLLDRGPDSGKVVELLRRLEREAARAGGRVHILLGNHEAMRILGDYRYVSAGEYAAFRTPGSQDLRERYYQLLLDANRKQARAAGAPFDEKAFRTQFIEEAPLGFVEMQMAFAADSDLGRWVRGLNSTIAINGIVFMHGGPTAAVAALGCDAINTRIRAELGAVTLADPNFARSLIGGADGPLWYRGLVDGSPSVALADVEAILKALRARAIVVGHTVTPDFRITARFGGRVLQIDTGMIAGEFFPGGVASALEIQGNTWTAIYEGRREVIRAAPPQG